MPTEETEAQALTSMQASDIRVYLPPTWLTRRFVLLTLFCMFTVGPIPVVLLITAGDQFVRNKINQWMSGPDLYNHITLQKDEYEHLPVRWRQVFAELVVRFESKTAGLRELIKTLHRQHIELVDRIAPYVVQDFIVRDNNQPSKHPLSKLSVVDFATLEDLGILQSVQRGHEITVDFARSSTQQANWSGSTVVLSMKAQTPETKVKLPITRFTEPGLNLIRLLRVPSDVRYFEWLAKQLEKSNIHVDLWSVGSGIDHGKSGIVSAGRIQRSSIPIWPIVKR